MAGVEAGGVATDDARDVLVGERKIARFQRGGVRVRFREQIARSERRPAERNLECFTDARIGAPREREPGNRRRAADDSAAKARHARAARAERHRGRSDARSAPRTQSPRRPPAPDAATNADRRRGRPLCRSLGLSGHASSRSQAVMHRGVAVRSGRPSQDMRAASCSFASRSVIVPAVAAYRMIRFGSVSVLTSHCVLDAGHHGVAVSGFFSLASASVTTATLSTLKSAIVWRTRDIDSRFTCSRDCPGRAIVRAALSGKCH